jgi:phage shock protein PspC (stress-responsive transcriptional regulator)
METNFASQLHGRRLARSADDRMIAGVAGGVAEYLDVDPTIVRIAAGTLALCGGLGVPLYLAAWALLPERPGGHSILDDLLGHVEQD